MRTTIWLDEALLQEAERMALATGRTLTELIEEALREKLTPRRTQQVRKHVKLTTFAGTGLQPGVDLDDSAALLDLMNSTDAAAGR